MTIFKKQKNDDLDRAPFATIRAVGVERKIYMLPPNIPSSGEIQLGKETILPLPGKNQYPISRQPRTLCTPISEDSDGSDADSLFDFQTPSGRLIRFHRMLQPGEMPVLDMSKDIAGVLIPALHEYLNMPASIPLAQHMTLCCDAWEEEPLVIASMTGLTVGQILGSIHARMHSPLDEPVERGCRQSLPQNVSWIDLLEGRHHFVGLQEMTRGGGAWEMLFQ